MIKNRIKLWTAAILLATIALSCDNDYGILANIQQEKKQLGTKVFQKTSVSNAFRLGSSYYAATATLNRRSVSDSLWSAIDIAGHATYALRGAVLVGTSMYALIDNGSAIELDSWTDAAGAWSSVTLPAGSNFDALYSSNNELFAENHNLATGIFTLYHLNLAGPAFELVANFAPAANKSIRGVGYDGSAYWFASEDKLISNTAANGSGTAADLASTFFTGLSSKAIWGISTVGTSVYVATTDGNLYQSGTAAPAALSSAVALSAVCSVPAASGTELLVGTDILTNASGQALGYFEGVFPNFAQGDNGAVTKNSAIYSTTVKNFPVHAFYFDGAANTLFICVSPGSSSSTYYGLYSSAWNGSAWSGWTAE